MQKAVWILILSLAFTSCKKREEYTTGISAYQGACSKCHKMNGEGGTKGPELTAILVDKDEAFVRQYTKDPRSLKADGTMPPSELTDHELDLVIAYIREQGRVRKN